MSALHAITSLRHAAMSASPEAPSGTVSEAGLRTRPSCTHRNARATSISSRNAGSKEISPSKSLRNGYRVTSAVTYEVLGSLALDQHPAEDRPVKWLSL